MRSTAAALTEAREAMPCLSARGWGAPTGMFRLETWMLMMLGTGRRPWVVCLELRLRAESCRLGASTEQVGGQQRGRRARLHRQS